MTTLAATANAAADARPGRSLWGDAFVRLRRDKGAVACFFIIFLYAAVAVGAPLVLSGWESSYDYNNAYAAASLKSFRLLLGTDVFGRSIMEKTLLGAHVSMTVAFMANVIAVPLGMLLGAVAGYYGRKTDDLIVWFYTTLASIPSIILLIAVKFAFADRRLFEGSWFQIDMGGMAGLIFALGVMSWIGTCRLVRAETMKIRELDYVLAARAAGSGNLSILIKHVIPNVAHIGIIQFSLGFVGSISAEVILSYLGLGVKDLPSWGKMIDSARLDLGVGRWAEVTAATAAIFLIVLAWNVFGDRLRDALDPRLRNV
jgi:peptide/nickel transport system permease protein